MPDDAALENALIERLMREEQGLPDPADVFSGDEPNALMGGVVDTGFEDAVSEGDPDSFFYKMFVGEGNNADGSPLELDPFERALRAKGGPISPY